MYFKLLIGTLSCFLLFSCGDISQDDSTAVLVNLIKTNQGKWEASNITTYTFTYYSAPTDCPTADPFPPAEITVENNTVTNLYVPELGINLDISANSYPTINEIYNDIFNSIEDIKEVPLFDEYFGYPINYKTDVSAEPCDGNSITLSSFI
ncbi:DUF6174 domain-containing protein [Paraglaciecola sp.]|uniref:DUF6174 domain-containing protein n=1 Tax=Paraglaciecola sp. TaxID=1920173 RepID=UPI003EF7EB4A